MKTFTTSIITAALFAAAANSATAQTIFMDLVTGTETLSSGPVPAGSYVENYTNLGNSMYFFGRDKVAGSPNMGSNLYKTDGTPAGTTLIKTIGPVAGLNMLMFGLADFNGATVFTTRLNGIQLWKSDGTAAGTSSIKTFTASYPNSNFPNNFCTVGNTCYFSADGGNGLELWKTDGTAAGTSEVIHLWTGTIPGFGAYNSHSGKKMFGYNGKVYFWATNSGGQGLFTSDGTAAGTTLLKATPSPNETYFIVLNGTLFFNDNNGLWKTDGTVANTVQVPGITNINSMILFNNELFVAGTKLYKTDGTAAGTQTILTAAGGIHGANSNAFYMRDYSVIPPKFYKCDGTVAGSGPIDYRVGAAASFEVINNKMYATHSDSGVVQSYNNSFLWETDGTFAGTTKLISFNYGVHQFAGKLFYQNSDATNGNEPWIYAVAGSTVTNPNPNPNPATGIAGQSNDTQINVFPNPADQQLTVTLGKESLSSRFEIHNTLGQLIKSEKLSSSQTTINVSDMPKGIYVYRIVQDQVFGKNRQAHY